MVDQRPRVCTFSFFGKIKPLIIRTPVLISRPIIIVRLGKGFVHQNARSCGLSRPIIIVRLGKGFVHQNARSCGLSIEKRISVALTHCLWYRTVVCMFLHSYLRPSCHRNITSKYFAGTRVPAKHASARVPGRRYGNTRRVGLSLIHI